MSTFGIDVSSAQTGINFALAKAEGVQFVIVKAGGLNIRPMYAAPSYPTLLDNARAAGLKVGHYWMIGAGQSPTAQAAFFVAHLHHFDLRNDVLALDNEHIDGNGTNFNDAQVAEFFAEVRKLTGIPASRCWHYANSNDYHHGVPWSRTEAMGIKVWWASYGANSTSRTPTSAPTISGVVKAWTVHQFSSRQVIAGHTVDGNISPLPLASLFATNMPIPKPTPAPAPVPVPIPTPKPVPTPKPPVPAPAPDRIVIPVGVPIKPGDFYQIGDIEFGVDTTGACVIRHHSTGKNHAVLSAVAVAQVEYQPDGNLVGRDAKGKAVWNAGTVRKAAGGQCQLFANGQLVIFNSKHVLVRKWG